MEQENKAELFNKLATAVDKYAWVSASLLKEKFGTIDDEEEYKKVEQEVVDDASSVGFKEAVRTTEIGILEDIITTATTTIRELQNGDN